MHFLTCFGSRGVPMNVRKSLWYLWANELEKVYAPPHSFLTVRAVNVSRFLGDLLLAYKKSQLDKQAILKMNEFFIHYEQGNNISNYHYFI